MTVSDTVRPSRAEGDHMAIGPPRLARFSHVHVRTPDINASLEFFTEVLGFYETERVGGASFLRAWGEWAHHSLILSEAAESGLERLGFLVAHPAHLDGFAERLAAGGVAVTRVAAGEVPGQGAGIRFTASGGQEWELVEGIERIVRPERHSRILDRPAPLGGRDASPRRLQHANILVPDPRATREWLEQQLGFKSTLIVKGPDGFEPFSTVTATHDMHELAISLDPHSSDGRLHHVAVWYDTPGDLIHACEVLAEHGVKAEAGLGKHGGGESWFYYIREPGGNRVELFTGGTQFLDPTPGISEPVVWDVADADQALVMIGQDMSEEFLTTGTPGP